MKCLIIDHVDACIVAELSKYMEIDTHILPSHDQLLELIPAYEVLIMRIDPAIDRHILDAAVNLKIIGVCSVGLNHIDMNYAKQKGITVFNAPGLNANAVAELTLCKMLELSRGTVYSDYDVKHNRKWDKYRFVGRELRGRKLGILGFGRIGRRVGELSRAFGMEVLAYDPYLKPEDFEKEHAVGMDMDTLLREADYVSIHMPLTPETKNLIDAKRIEEMKDDCIVLNMARGGIVNEADMFEALKTGKMGGYGTDVMENELAGDGFADAAAPSPLFDCDQFIVTPHSGAQTIDAAHDIGLHIVSKVKEALQLS